MELLDLLGSITAITLLVAIMALVYEQIYFFINKEQFLEHLKKSRRIEYKHGGVSAKTEKKIKKLEQKLNKK